MNEELQKLYNVISQHFNVGSFEDFSAKMKTTDDRKRFYDAVTNAGFDIGNYTDYEQRLKKKESSEIGFKTTAKKFATPEDISKSVGAEIAPEPVQDLTFEQSWIPDKPNAFEYISGKAANQSLLLKGVKYLVNLDDALQSNEKEPLKTAIEDYRSQINEANQYLNKYEPNKWEDVAAFALGIFLDTPLFAAYGTAGKASVKGISKGAQVLKGALIKRGLTSEAAEKVTQTALKKFLARSIEAGAESGSALGLYNMHSDVARQIEEGADFNDIDWQESLKEGAVGSALGMTLGVFGQGFGTMSNIATKQINNGVKKLAVKTGIGATAFQAENAVFLYGDAVLRGKSVKDIGWEDWMQSYATLGALKAGHALTRATRSKYASEKKPVLEFTTEESNLLKNQTGNEIKTTESFIGKDEDIKKVLDDPKIPVVSKAKILWTEFGVKPDVDMDITKTTTLQDGTLKTFNAQGDLLDIKKFTDKSEADQNAVWLMENVADVQNRRKAESLSPEQKAELNNRLSAKGFDYNLFSDATDKIAVTRSTEEKGIVKKYNDEVDKLIQEAQKATSIEGELKKSTKVPPKEVTPLYEAKKQTTIVNKKEKVKPEEVSLGEQRSTTESEQRILKTGKNSFFRPIKADEKEVGGITVEPSKDKWAVKRVDVNPEDQNRGIATETYRKLNQEAVSEGKILTSDVPDKINNESKRIWESLVKSGEAEKLDDGSYKFKEEPKNAITEGKITENNQQQYQQTETRGLSAEAGSGNRNEPGGKIKEEKAPSEKEIISSAGSVEELQDALSRGQVKFSPEYNKKIAELRDQGKLERSSDIIKNIEKTFQKEKAKPTGSSFLFGGPLDIFKSSREKRKPPRPLRAVLREQFGRTKGLPVNVFEAAVRTEGRIKARQKQVEYDYRDIVNEAHRILGNKFTEENKQAIQDALNNLGTTKESADQAFENLRKTLPEELKGIVERMRNNIDAASEDIAKLDMIGVNLEEKIDKNRGHYITRTYKKHTDRNWVWETIPDQIKKDAAKVLYDLMPEKEKTGKTDEQIGDQILGELKNILESKDIVSSVVHHGQSLADIDKGILKKRSVFLTDNPEIRAFLGENNDPFYNYAVSLTKMAEIIERGRLLESIRDIGLNEGFLSEDPSYEKGHTVKIKYSGGIYGGKKGVKQLSDYYTTPDIANAIAHYMQPTSFQNKALRVWMQGVTTVKIAKTAGSVKGVIRNFKSNTTNAVANANWNFVETGKELKERLSSQSNRKEFMLEMLDNAVIGDSSNAKELIRNVQDLSDKLSYVAGSDETMLEKGRRKLVGAMLKTYAAADDVWKAYRYVSEYSRYRDAYVKGGMDPTIAKEQAKEDVIKILHKTSTYYSQLPKVIQNMRKLPFTNTFVSWPYLTLTNFMGTLDVAFKEMRDPYLRPIGVQRLAGTTLALSVLAGTAYAMSRKAGQTLQNLDDWRRFLPDFWSNDVIAINKDNGDGTAEYSNFSYLDYYGVVTTPVAILARKAMLNHELSDDDLKDAMQEFAGRFISWDILFDRMTNLKNNVDPDTGRKIYNPEDDYKSKVDAMVGYVWRAIEPGTLTDIKRIRRTAREGGQWGRQFLGVLTGSQKRTIDPIKSLRYFKIPKYRESIDDSRRIYTDELHRYNRLKTPTEADDKKLEATRQRSVNALTKNIEEMIKDYDAAIRLGIDPIDLDVLFKARGMDKDVTNAVLYRLPININAEGKIVPF